MMTESEKLKNRTEVQIKHSTKRRFYNHLTRISCYLLHTSTAIKRGQKPVSDAASGPRGHAAATAATAFAIRTPRVPRIHAGNLQAEHFQDQTNADTKIFNSLK